MRYLLNSAVITAPGAYTYRLISPEEARDWDCVSSEPVSTIGYEQTANALAIVLHRPVAVNRVMVTMAPGDEAMVMRITPPAGTPRIDPSDKGRLTEEIMAGHFELGLLVRTS